MTDTWRPYEPCNEPTEEAPRQDSNKDLCASCGHPRVPHNYRHIFVEWEPGHPQSANAQKRMLASEKQTCKLHSDCRAADEMVRAAGGRTVKYGGEEYISMSANHAY